MQVFVPRFSPWPLGVQQTIKYFSDPKNHLDDDKTHVSMAEIKSAIGAVPPEANEFLKQIVVSKDGYQGLRALQCEGLIFNDEQVSMQDLYAASRAYGYYNKPVKLTFASRGIYVDTAFPDRPTPQFIDSEGLRYYNFLIIDGPEAGRVITCKVPPDVMAGVWNAKTVKHMLYQYSYDRTLLLERSSCLSFLGDEPYNPKP